MDGDNVYRTVIRAAIEERWQSVGRGVNSMSYPFAREAFHHWEKRQGQAQWTKRGT